VRFDPDFARVYLVEKQIQITLLKQGDAQLWQQASTIIESGIAQLRESPYNVPESWFVKQAAKYSELRA